VQVGAILAALTSAPPLEPASFGWSVAVRFDDEPDIGDREGQLRQIRLPMELWLALGQILV
jgi:hypothetical protein